MISNKAPVILTSLVLLLTIPYKQHSTICLAQNVNSSATASLINSSPTLASNLEVELINEIRNCFVNITLLSIDGQAGETEREKYYKFYDSVQNYLELLKSVPQNSSSFQNDVIFKRTLKTIEFGLGEDPLVSSFFDEYLLENGTRNANFDYYEDFLRYTDFGKYYASNITQIRSSVTKFDKLSTRLLSINFTSQLTRPSAKYQAIRRLSRELYKIKNQLESTISERILTNRQDVIRIFNKLDTIVKKHPYIRMIGDEKDEDAMKLNELLYNYLSNNMTAWSFYDKLSQLPDDYIRLGALIGREYETREIPLVSRFDNGNFVFAPNTISTSIAPTNANKQPQVSTPNISTAIQSPPPAARKNDSPSSLMSRFIGR